MSWLKLFPALFALSCLASFFPTSVSGKGSFDDDGGPLSFAIPVVGPAWDRLGRREQNVLYSYYKTHVENTALLLAEAARAKLRSAEAAASFVKSKAKYVRALLHEKWQEGKRTVFDAKEAKFSTGHHVDGVKDYSAETESARLEAQDDLTRALYWQQISKEAKLAAALEKKKVLEENLSPAALLSQEERDGPAYYEVAGGGGKPTFLHRKDDDEEKSAGGFTISDDGL